jgi:PST family polysaccharide transporter
MVSDYGFNLAGTREVSLYRDDKNKISEIFSSILILKFFLGLLCTVVLFILVFSVELFSANRLLYFISTGTLFCSIFFPVWFLQGIEKMETIPAINISIRALQVILIFILIKKESDYILYLVLISATQLAIGIAGLMIAIYFFKVKINFPSGSLLKGYLKSGFSLFSANIGTNLFTNSNTFVLGILVGNYAVGIFSAADKIRLAVQSIIVTFITSTYPNAVRLVKERKSMFVNFIKKTFVFSVLIGIIASLFLFLFAEQIVTIVLGGKFQGSIVLLQWFSINPMIVSAGIVFSILVLVAKGYDNLFAKVTLSSIVIHFVLLIFLILSFNTLGTVYAVIITELLISSLSVFVVYKKRLLKPV